ncbi:UNVERIFIED_CONTAM: hypothetical protein K2H54_054455 [Gekko kuhli]
MSHLGEVAKELDKASEDSGSNLHWGSLTVAMTLRDYEREHRFNPTGYLLIWGKKAAHGLLLKTPGLIHEELDTSHVHIFAKYILNDMVTLLNS